MKKFWVTFFILLILAGAAFFAGWVQFSVPPGSYGVIVSKTHGYDPKVIKTGEFRWLWYKLIPTNVKIAVFNPEEGNFNVSLNSSLPSGDIYASFAGLGNADFTWELKASILFSIDPDKLVQLVSSNNINNQEELNEYMRKTAKGMEVIVLRILTSSETDSERLEKILAGNQDYELEAEVKNTYSQIKDFSFMIQSAKFPDFVLYRNVRLLYEEFLAKQREYISSSFGRRAESLIEARFRFEELERYGELLTKYPALLDYLTLEKSGKANE